MLAYLGRGAVRAPEGGFLPSISSFASNSPLGFIWPTGTLKGSKAALELVSLSWPLAPELTVVFQLPASSCPLAACPSKHTVSPPNNSADSTWIGMNRSDIEDMLLAQLPLV